MSKKTTTTNGLAQDLIKGAYGITLNNRTHNSQINYFITKQIEFVSNNIAYKQKAIALLEADQQDAVSKHREQQEELDHGAMLKRERDIEWHMIQIEVAESYLEYLKQASQQMFPEQHQKSEQNAGYFEKVMAKYSA